MRLLLEPENVCSFYTWIVCKFICNRKVQIGLHLNLGEVACRLNFVSLLFKIDNEGFLSGPFLMSLSIHCLLLETQ